MIRGDAIRQLSTDHTWIQEAIEHGALTPEEAVGHPNAHVIRRYLGSRQPVVPDLRLRMNAGESDDQAESNQGLRLLPGDQLLLCSDGLTDLVSDAEILATLKTKSQDEALDELVSLANQRGGHDNITIVSLQMPEALPQAMPALPVNRKRPLRLACLATSSLLLASIVLLGGLFLYFNRPFNSPAFLPSETNTLIPTQSKPAITTPGSPIPATLPAVTQTHLPGGIPTPNTSLTPISATLTPWPTNTIIP
jgi:protein phosphatase